VIGGLLGVLFRAPLKYLALR